MTDLAIPPRRGMPHGLTIPDSELVERFSRSSGPGGQGVNTTDSRVELSWDVLNSAALTDWQRARLLERIAGRLVDGVITIAASEHRAQLQNRNAARARLTNYVADRLEPPPRRPRKPSRAARARRMDTKRRRGDVKATRRNPPPD